MRVLVLLLLIVAICKATCAVEPPITDLFVVPSAGSVVAASQSGVTEFTLPDLKGGRSIELNFANLHSLAFSSDTTKLAIGGGDPADSGAVAIVEWPAEQTIQLLEGHADSVLAVAWLGNDRLLSASRDRTIKLWDVQSGKATKTFQGHSRSVTDLCVLPDARQFVSVGDDQSVRVWDIESGKLVRSLIQHTRPIHALALKPVKVGLPMIATAAGDKTIRFWQPTIGRMVRYLRLPAAPLDIEWKADGSQLVAACKDGVVRFIDPLNVTILGEQPVLESWAYAIVRSGESQFVVAGVDADIKVVQAP